LAGHLAGCPDCAAESERLRQSALLIREVVLESPPPELRERTLALVREVGRPRGTVAQAPANATPAAPAFEPPQPIDAGRRRRSWRAVALPLGLAAAIVLTVIGTAAVVSNRNATALAESQETTAELAQLASWSLRVSAEPDATRISLVGSPGTKASGTLLYSPTSTDLVVVARGLAPAPAGQEYRCWVLVNGNHQDVGLMEIGAGLAYWVGPVPGLEDLPAGTPFGVSLAQVNGTISSADPVLSGTVGG
ncbi:MAG TPA: anti-sigma factor, partial [Candidatus Limnocylindrales bacterium]